MTEGIKKIAPARIVCTNCGQTLASITKNTSAYRLQIMCKRCGVKTNLKIIKG